MFRLSSSYIINSYYIFNVIEDWETKRSRGLRVEGRDTVEHAEWVYKQEGMQEL